MSTADIEQLVQVVLWALGCAVLVMVLVAVGTAPWQWLGRVLAALTARYVAFAERVPESDTNERERRSDAAERGREPLGTMHGNVVPVAELPAFLGDLDDALLVELLALIPGDKDGWRFADSAVAKFVPGRNEGWMQLIRELRDKEPPPEPEPARRFIAMRHMGDERMVPLE
jgi:hypothetical protein